MFTSGYDARIHIRETEYLYIYDEPLDKLYKIIEEAREKLLSKGVEDSSIIFCSESYYDSGSINCYLEGIRNKTQEELDATAALLKKAEDRERETYERLKKKYGD